MGVLFQGKALVHPIHSSAFREPGLPGNPWNQLHRKARANHGKYAQHNLIANNFISIESSSQFRVGIILTYSTNVDIINNTAFSNSYGSNGGNELPFDFSK